MLSTRVVQYLSCRQRYLRTFLSRTTAKHQKHQKYMVWKTHKRGIYLRSKLDSLTVDLFVWIMSHTCFLAYNLTIHYSRHGWSCQRITDAKLMKNNPVKALLLVLLVWITREQCVVYIQSRQQTRTQQNPFRSSRLPRLHFNFPVKAPFLNDLRASGSGAAKICVFQMARRSSPALQEVLIRFRREACIDLTSSLCHSQLRCVFL